MQQLSTSDNITECAVASDGDLWHRLASVHTADCHSVPSLVLHSRDETTDTENKEAFPGLTINALHTPLHEIPDTDDMGAKLISNLVKKRIGPSVSFIE